VVCHFSVFFTVTNGRRLLRGHLSLRVCVGFPRPLAQDFLGQLTHLHAHALLGLIGVAALAPRLIQRVGDSMHLRQHGGPVR
jgi:hypothetical protein